MKPQVRGGLLPRSCGASERPWVGVIRLTVPALLLLLVAAAGCSVPVLRTPTWVNQSDYESEVCRDARALDRQAVRHFMPASCWR